MLNPDKAALAYVDGEEGDELTAFLIESNVYTDTPETSV